MRWRALLSTTEARLVAMMLVAVPTLLAGALVFESINPFRGTIETGSKYGIRVGDRFPSADETLTKSGFTSSGRAGCDPAVGILSKCDAPDQKFIYRKPLTIGRTYLELVVVDGRVSAISWETFILPYVDS